MNLRSPKRVVRNVLGRTARAIAIRADNFEIRRLLYPDEVLTGTQSVVALGHRSYFNQPPRVHSYMPGDGHVTVGRYSSVAADVEFLTGGFHHHRWVTTSPLLPETPPATVFSKGDITIGNDVWIGRGAMIMCGVNIGDGAVVGARALVTKNVRPYSIVGGTPAQEIDRRFSDDIVRRLLALQWWNWPDERVATFASLMLSDDVNRFLAAAESGSETGQED